MPNGQGDGNHLMVTPPAAEPFVPDPPLPRTYAHPPRFPVERTRAAPARCRATPAWATKEVRVPASTSAVPLAPVLARALACLATMANAFAPLPVHSSSHWNLVGFQQAQGPRTRYLNAPLVNPNPDPDHAAVRVDQRVLVLGGGPAAQPRNLAVDMSHEVRFTSQCTGWACSALSASCHLALHQTVVWKGDVYCVGGVIHSPVDNIDEQGLPNAAEDLAANEVCVYRPAKNTWEGWAVADGGSDPSAKSNCPTAARQRHTATLVGDELVVIGGSEPEQAQHITVVDLLQHTCVTFPAPIQLQRQCHAAVHVPGEVAPVTVPLTLCRPSAVFIVALCHVAFTLRDDQCVNLPLTVTRHGPWFPLGKGTVLIFGGHPTGMAQKSMRLSDAAYPMEIWALSLETMQCFHPLVACKVRSEEPVNTNGLSATRVGATIYVFGGALSQWVNSDQLFALDLLPSGVLQWEHLRPATSCTPEPVAFHGCSLVDPSLLLPVVAPLVQVYLPFKPVCCYCHLLVPSKVPAEGASCSADGNDECMMVFGGLNQGGGQSTHVHLLSLPPIKTLPDKFPLLSLPHLHAKCTLAP
eukprot:gene9922-260_t